MCWNYDHSKGRAVQGFNLLNCLYRVGDISIEEQPLQEENMFTVWFKVVPFPVLIVRQVFTNEDGSLYLACSDTTMTCELVLRTCQK
jgi:hypothetical protein